MPTLNELLSVDLSFQEILEQLEEETEDFTVLSGEVAFSSQFEFETAKSILENHYENVEEKGLDVVDGEGESAFTIEFSSPFVDDLDFPDEEVEESFELRESDETNTILDVMKNNKQYNDYTESLVEKIVKNGSKWQVQSEKGKNLGTYNTKKDAKNRLRQVEYFKHIDEELKPVPRGSSIVYTPEFEKNAKKLNLTDEDLVDLEESLFTYPPDASLGGNVYKFR